MIHRAPLLEGIAPVLKLLTGVESPLVRRDTDYYSIEKILVDAATGEFAECVAAARDRFATKGEQFEDALRREVLKHDIDPLTVLFLDLFSVCVRTKAESQQGNDLMREFRYIQRAIQTYTFLFDRQESEQASQSA